MTVRRAIAARAAVASQSRAAANSTCAAVVQATVEHSRARCGAHGGRRSIFLPTLLGLRRRSFRVARRTFFAWRAEHHLSRSGMGRSRPTHGVKLATGCCSIPSASVRSSERYHLARHSFCRRLSRRKYR